MKFRTVALATLLAAVAYGAVAQADERGDHRGYGHDGDRAAPWGDRAYRHGDEHGGEWRDRRDYDWRNHDWRDHDWRGYDRSVYLYRAPIAIERPRRYYYPPAGYYYAPEGYAQFDAYPDVRRYSGYPVSGLHLSLTLPLR